MYSKTAKYKVCEDVDKEKSHSLVALSSLHERVKRGVDKCQEAGMMDVSATLMECGQVFDRIEKHPAVSVVKGIATHVKKDIILDSRFYGAPLNIVGIYIVTYYKRRGWIANLRTNCWFITTWTPLANEIEENDVIAVDGVFRNMERSCVKSILYGMNLEIIKKARTQTNGNSITPA